jgi:carbamoyl-phosphate synthase large subunit
VKKISILITAAGGDIGGNIINILSQRDEIGSIVGTDLKEKIFSVNSLDKFYKVDRVDSPNYREQIYQIVEENCIDIIFPVSEREIIWFKENQEFFEDLNVKIAINNTKILDTFFNKLVTSVELNKIGVLTPKTILFSEFKDQLDFPLILKSNYSINTKDRYIVTTHSQLEFLRASLENPQDYIIQQYVGTPREEYTTAVYRDNNRCEVITFKRDLTGGMTSFATVSNEKALVHYAKKIAEVFDLRGSINIQSRKVEDQFYVFEINPRISSTVYIRDHFNFKDLLWWVCDVADIDIKSNTTPIARSGIAILGYVYNFYRAGAEGDIEK